MYRDTGLASIEALISQRGGFDYILLETSGLADPGNLAPLFWTDDGLGSNTYLDGIVTVVDAKNILTSLSETPSHPEVEEAGDATEGQKTDEDHAGEHLTTAHLQISHADVIVLNKADTVTPEQLDAVHGRVTSINGLAKIHVTQHSRVPHLEGFLLDLHAYDGVKGLEEVEKKGHSHIDPVLPLFLFLHTKFTHRTYPTTMIRTRKRRKKKLTQSTVHLHPRPPHPHPLTLPIRSAGIMAPAPLMGKYPAPTFALRACRPW